MESFSLALQESSTSLSLVDLDVNSIPSLLVLKDELI